MTNWVYLPEFSGAALQSHRLAKELRQLGVHVQMLTGTHENSLVGSDRIDDVIVHRKLRDISSVSGRLKYWWELDRFIHKNCKRIDLVHTHGFHPRVNLAAKRAGLPIVTKITNQTVDDPISVLARRGGSLKYKIYNHAEAVIATSKVLEELCLSAGMPKDKIIRIPNGVDTEIFCPAQDQEKQELRRNFLAPEDKIILLTVGTVNYTKGLDLLIRALYKLDAEAKDKIRVWVVGPSTNRDSYGSVQIGFEEYVPKVKSMICEFGLENIVQFKGRQSNVNEYMRAADVYIHPSRKEGQPNAIIEAMASGLPVVANLLPGITDEILQSGRFGYLVDGEESREFAAVLQMLINNKSLRDRISSQSREHILKYYSLKQIAQRYLSLYSSVIHKGVFEELKNKTLAKKKFFLTGARDDGQYSERNSL